LRYSSEDRVSGKVRPAFSGNVGSKTPERRSVTG
jgi:hypothetical protein